MPVLRLNPALLPVGCALGPAADLGADVQRFLAAWKKDRDGLPVYYGKKDDEDSTLALGKAMLEAFCESKALPQKIIAVEKSFALEVPDLASDVPLILRGRIDLIEVRDGALWIVDHKTARSTPNDYADLDQLAIYTAAARELNLGVNLPMRARFDVITKTKTPRLEAFPVWIPEPLIRVTLDKVRAIHHAMDAGIIYPGAGVLLRNLPVETPLPR